MPVTSGALMAWSKQSRHERGYGTAWDKLRKVILTAEPLCRECKRTGRVTIATDLDHIKPKAKGGTDEPANLQPLCRACHETKTTRENGGKVRLEIGLDGWPKG